MPNAMKAGHTWSFWIIIQGEAQQEAGGAAMKSRDGIKATNRQAVVAKQNIMASGTATYEFKKTARHEMTEVRTEAQWD